MLIHQLQQIIGAGTVDAQEMIQHRGSDAIAIAGVQLLDLGVIQQNRTRQRALVGRAGGTDCCTLAEHHIHKLFAHLAMGRELAANQGNQVFCPFFGVVMKDVRAGNAACLFAFGIGQGPHPE
jgi:hypothetical protein